MATTAPVKSVPTSSGPSSERTLVEYRLEGGLAIIELNEPPLNGHTVGGGLEIAMACDIRLAAQDAGKIGLPEVSLGVLPGTGGTQRVARIVGKSRSIEMMVKGETFSFERAHELGLVNEVFPKDGFWDQVLMYAKQFCPPNKASKAVGHIKRAVCSGLEVPFESGLAIERELQQLLFQSEDAKEGLAAYVEKRVRSEERRVGKEG